MLIAALLRHRDELLALTGPHLRLLLAEILSPAKMATFLNCEGDGKEETVSKSPLVLWCEEAEALDLATPESFRHHLGLIGEIAEAEHEVNGWPVWIIGHVDWTVWRRGWGGITPLVLGGAQSGTRKSEAYRFSGGLRAMVPAVF